MVEDLDKGIGKILTKLEQDGYMENTLVIFFSDNGPSKTGNTGGLAGHKGQVFEGGIRVPCIIRWPGMIATGTVSDQVTISMDLTKSIINIVQAIPNYPLDGMDIIEHVSSLGTNSDRTLFWRKKRGDQVFKAVRNGNMKYISNHTENGTQEYLFDLSQDIGEQHNPILYILKVYPERFGLADSMWKEKWFRSKKQTQA